LSTAAKWIQVILPTNEHLKRNYISCSEYYPVLKNVVDNPDEIPEHFFKADTAKR
jgi:hypothetical protein